MIVIDSFEALMAPDPLHAGVARPPEAEGCELVCEDTEILIADPR